MKKLRPFLFLFFFSFLTVESVHAACTITAGFTYVDSSGFIRFTNTSTGNYNRLNYTYTSGYVNSGKYIYYTKSGNVTVTLIAFDTLNMSCYDTFTTTFYTNGRCMVVADFTYSDNNTVLNQVDFVTKGYQGDSSYWDFGDSSSYSGFDNSHQYKTFGIYTVLYKTFQKKINGCKDSIFKTVVIQKCSVNAVFNITLLSGNTYKFNNTSINATNYEWNTGDGFNYTTNNPMSHLYNDDGAYLVRLIAKQKNRTACVDTTYQRVPGATCRIKANFSHKYKDDVRNLFFDNKSRCANQFYWTFGDGSTSSNVYPIHRYKDTGVYSVRLIVEDTGFSNCRDTFYKQVGAYFCQVKSKIGFTDSLGYVKLVALSTGSNKHYWYNNGDNKLGYMRDSGYGSFRNYTFNGCGKLTVKLNSYDTIGLCSDFTVASFTLKLLDAKFVILPDSNNLYAGMIYNQSKGSIAANYLWNFGDGDTSTSYTPTHVYSGNGPYNLCLTLSNANGCTSTWCDTIQFDTSGHLKRNFIRNSISTYTGRKVGTNLTFLNSDLKLYPSPVLSNLTIESILPISQINVLSLDGKLIMSKALDSEKKCEIHLDVIPQGFYIIEVHSTNGLVMREKIIKQ